MKQYLFILSHEGAGSTLLSRILNSTKKVAGITKSGIIYDSLDSIESLNFKVSNHPNVFNNKPIYCDVIKYNEDLYCDTIYNLARFIFLIRSPDQINWEQHGKNSYRRYCFRLRRLCEISRNIQDSLLLTFDDLLKPESFSFIEEFLNLNERIPKSYYTFYRDEGDIAIGRIIENNNRAINNINCDKYKRYLKILKTNCKISINY